MQGSSQTKDQGGSPAQESSGVPSLKPKLTIQNVVSTFFLGRKNINLKSICSRARYLEFNPHKFAAATLRLKNPRCTSLIFNSGNMVCTGGKSSSDSRFACRQCVNILQRSGLKVGFCNYKVQNIVGSTSLSKPIDLIQLQKDYGPYSSYEPELFLVCFSASKTKNRLATAAASVVTEQRQRSKFTSTGMDFTTSC